MPAIPGLTAWVRRSLERPSCLSLASLPEDINSVILNLERSSNQELNKEVYLIRQPVLGRGMFSLVSSVVCHLHVARRFGLTPVVDFSSAYRTEYNDSEFEQQDQDQRTNAWDYYFQPVSSMRLDDAYRCRRILSSVSSFPNRYPVTISHIRELRRLTCETILPSQDIAREVDKIFAKQFLNHIVLGVHYRGQEQKTMPYHPLSPTTDQLHAAIDLAIETHGFDRLFAVSEDADHIAAIQARYGSMVITNPHFRTHAPTNAYRIKPRAMHKYLLGKEILIDALLLSRCQGLVSGPSTVNEFCRSYNNEKYIIDLVIDNGFNATQPSIAKHLWNIKSRLPEEWGGFSTQALKPFPISIPSTE
jgi:hypothetical protein